MQRYDGGKINYYVQYILLMRNIWPSGALKKATANVLATEDIKAPAQFSASPTAMDAEGISLDKAVGPYFCLDANQQIKRSFGDAAMIPTSLIG